MDFEAWKRELEEAWGKIPKPFRSDRAVHATLVCRLFRLVEEAGYRAVAGYMPPRMQDRPVDVIGVSDENRVVCAICVDTLVSLPAVKSLTSFDSEYKLVFTTGPLEKKVQESRFFLKPGVEHLHLQPKS